MLVAHSVLRIPGWLCPYPPQCHWSPFPVICPSLWHVQSSACAVTLLLPGSGGCLRMSCCPQDGFVLSASEQRAGQAPDEDVIRVVTACWWSPPSSRLLFVPSLQCPARDRKIHWGKLEAAVRGCCSAHSWRYLEDDKESPRLCEMCWWFASLLQWIGLYSMV